jgi:alkylation response protein AidB-like acyl-CoA dehydrogenase
MSERLLDLLLGADPVAPPCATVAGWWQHHRALQPQWPRTVERAIAGGYAADRVGWAFAGAYQAALRALVPSLADDQMAALCVTEAQGTSPSAMQTTLRDDGQGVLQLDGAKRWTTLGPEGAVFLVAARDSREQGERPSIRLVQLASDTPGVHVQPMPPTSFVPEVTHAQLRFEQVRVDAALLLPGDGYARYVKPFRSIEDLHVHAAVLAYLLRESRRLAWPREWTARACACLLAFTAVAALDPSAATTHVALAGTLATGEQLVSEADRFWTGSADADAAARWQRDRKLLALAGQARAARLEKAWSVLAAAASAALPVSATGSS